jgi:MFS family permease
MQPTTLDEFRRGWRTLLASAVGNGSGLSGIPFYTFGVFIVPLVTAFGWTRGQVSIAASFMIIGTAITAPIIGSIIDKLGARRVAIISMSLVALGYMALTQVSGNIALFYAAWLLIALVGGGTTPVVWTRAVNMWFDRGRGLALGLALGGSGVASIFAPALVTDLIKTYGWQGGYLGVGIFIILISVPVIVVFFREKTHDTPTTQGVTAPVTVTGLSLEESLRRPAFWIIALGFFLVSAVIAALIINLVPLLIDRGLPQSNAAQVAGVMGIAVLLGRVGVGFLLDRFSAALVARVLLGCSAGGCLLLSIEGAPAWFAIVAVVSLGLAAAAEVDLVAYLTSRCFGLKSYGKIYGWQLTAFYIGAAVGPFCAGLAYDYFQGYLQVLYFACASLVLGAIVIGTITLPKEFARQGH